MEQKTRNVSPLVGPDTHIPGKAWLMFGSGRRGCEVQVWVEKPKRNRKPPPKTDLDLLSEELFPQRRPFSWQKRYDKPSDRRPGQYEGRKCLFVVAIKVLSKRKWQPRHLDALQIWLEKQAVKEGPVFVYYEMPLLDVLRSQKLKKDKARNDMGQLFDSHQQYVRTEARRAFWRYRTMCNPYLNIFRTLESGHACRCEDFESVIWENVWLGKGTGEKAIRYAIGAYVKDTRQKVERNPIEIESTGDVDILLRKVREGTYERDSEYILDVKAKDVQGPNEWRKKMKKLSKECKKRRNLPIDISEEYKKHFLSREICFPRT